MAIRVTKNDQNNTCQSLFLNCILSPPPKKRVMAKTQCVHSKMPLQLTYKNPYSTTSKRPENAVIFQPLSTGKEKDSETGYYYFGARYYNSDLSLWLSVDPMADKYPSLSPYNYCAWNPMKIVDPDGRDGEIIIDQESKNIKVSANYYYSSSGKYALDPNKSKANRFITNFKNSTLNSWASDIKEALSNDSRYEGYSINVEFNVYECSDPQSSATNDPIGNWLSVNPERTSGASTVDCNNISIAPLNYVIGENSEFDEYFSGFLKHEVGHTFGLYDRYKPEKSGAIYAAELMPNDLMYKLGGHDNTSAVKPFLRIWNSVVTKPSGRFLINKNNREKTPTKITP